MTQAFRCSECAWLADGRARRFVRWLGVAVLSGPWGGLATAAEPITRIAEVRQLPRARADQALPVRVRGVVTMRWRNDSLVVQDASAGVFVSFGEARNRHLWRGEDGILARVRVGTEVEIEGQSSPGGYAPLILAVDLHLLGSQPLPPARSIEPARFFSGADDCQRIEVRGVVQGFYRQGDEVALIMDANPGRFTASVSNSLVPDPEGLVDAELRLRGVATTRFNGRAEATGSRVVVGMPGDLVVAKPPTPLDQVPWVPLNQLLPFRTEPLGPHRVRVAGTVTYCLPGKFFYLQEGGNALRVETTSPILLQSGDRVEATGFVDMSRLIGTLRDGMVRQTGVAGIPQPEQIGPVEIRQIYETTAPITRIGQEGDYDGHLIRCRARLLAVESSPDSHGCQTLMLEQSSAAGPGTRIFQAVLYGGPASALDVLRPGSELELTGLVQLGFAANDLDFHRAKAVPVKLDLILRSAADLVVLQQPSWWTVPRVMAVLAAVLLALAGASVWNLQLKRQVRRKSKQLAREINTRRDAALEFRTTMRERNRLAANLHDTLPQTMSAIALQLDACEIRLRPHGLDALPPLKMIRRMVEFAVNELRSAVWEMRSLSLRGGSFSAALQRVVERVGDGHPAKITIHAEGPLNGLPEFVSGNLLMMVQEALRNARHHANAANISVDIRTTGPGAPIRLVVGDDGAGFAPGSQKGPEQGHYGIVGMRERAERLGGSLRVESSPGHGTRIVAEVSRHAADEDLDDEPHLPEPTLSESGRL